jgi:hypothetical protein
VVTSVTFRGQRETPAFTSKLLNYTSLAAAAACGKNCGDFSIFGTIPELAFRRYLRTLCGPKVSSNNPLRSQLPMRELWMSWPAET